MIKKDGRPAYLSRMHAFDYVNYLVLILFSLMVIYTMIYMLALSFSSAQGLLTSGYNPLLLLPRGFTLDAYKLYFSQMYIQTGYYATIFRTVVGTGLSMIVMSAGAYALSKKQLPLQGFITGFIVFTMFFSGGMIPAYMNIKNLGLLNNRWALILPVLFNTFYMLVLRNFFSSLPEALEESAYIDGANEFVIFTCIVIPLALPSIATIALWLVVDHWNAWFDSMIYISDMDKQVIQVHIRNLIIEQSSSALGVEASTYGARGDMCTGETLRAAAVMLTMLPILCVYPFIQKFFVKGVIVGSLKG